MGGLDDHARLENPANNAKLFQKLYRQAANNVQGASMPFVSSTLGSNMVLQQAPQSAVLWGWTSAPSSKVVVSFNGNNYTATSDDTDGLWTVSLPPTSASFQAYTIELASSAGDQATLTNVLFGDVYICGGQSNMQFTVSEAFNASTEIQDANNYPNIRLFTVGQGTYSNVSLANLATVEQPWSVASNTSVGGDDWAYFSAVCWFFVRDVYEAEQIPIGAFSSNWGGTVVQAWSSSDAIDACDSSVDPYNPPDPNRDNVLWNAMIVPLLPMRVKGAIWYQGEANAGQASVYECAFPAMISDWRAKFGYSASEFFFGFVQLAAYIEGTIGLGNGLPDTRLAQATALSLPNVGMATAIDLGDLGSPQGDIHPRDKQAVGVRLSLVAQQLVYGNNDVVSVGPIPAGNQFQINELGENITVSITFSSSVYLKPNVTCPAALLPANCSSFEVETSDGVWHSADSISQSAEDTIEITINNLSNTLLFPIGVRYAYSNWPLAIVYNNEDLPAIPFYIQTQI
eukprot:TRINITY_DN1964_c0_g1_i2.p1 TRINITY_DN1964_c0_g1~~TRINITY_DN1964_c0_g1_i2.p1  ORF type:complete len:561 (+),score=125.97 TRINITY_DN1964_c0_g1_i2:142-1683(+)